MMWTLSKSDPPLTQCNDLLRCDLAAQHSDNRGTEGEKTAIQPYCKDIDDAVLQQVDHSHNSDFGNPPGGSQAYPPRGPLRSSFALRSRRTAVLVVVLLVVTCFQAFERFNLSLLAMNPKTAAWRASNSSDGALNLAKLYPALENSVSEECKTVWEKCSAGILCHRHVLSLAPFDDRNVTTVVAAGLDPFKISLNVCNSSCIISVRQFFDAIHGRYNGRVDHFNVSHYGNDGVAYFAKDT